LYCQNFGVHELEKTNSSSLKLVFNGQVIPVFLVRIEKCMYTNNHILLSSAATYLPNNPYMALGSAKHGVPNQYMALGSEKCGVSILGRYHQGGDLFITLSF